MRIIKSNCKPEDAQDTKLPYTAYLVEYEAEGEGICYDLCIPQSQVEMFDYYYDRFKKGFRNFKQSDGRVNPSLWQTQTEPPKKKKRKRKPVEEEE